MDFDIALGKLERDHSKLRKESKQTKVSRERSRKLLKQRQKEYEVKKEKEEKEKLKYTKVENYMTRCEVHLLKRKLICGEERLLLKAAMIEGDGDKIKLPVSILESVVDENGDGGAMTSTSPLMFRIGVANPQYKFPASEELKAMMEVSEEEEYDDVEDNLKPFRSEMSDRYVTYTHAGVIEFTMEEGCVGLPPSIAKRLALPESSDTVQVEVSRVVLPKGTECSVCPSEQAIRNGFYQLKDVQAVLEQSIVRTRTTLSIGDTLHGWHRGMQFDLKVQSLAPPDFAAVSCIDTDITLHIISLPSPALPSTTTPTLSSPPKSLSSVPAQQLPLQPQQPQQQNPLQIQLPPEPPTEQTQNICLILVRSRDGNSIKRRFDITKSTVSDLLTFTSASLQQIQSIQFQLVSTFPRDVFALNDTRMLIDAGFNQGQQLLMVELIS